MFLIFTLIITATRSTIAAAIPVDLGDGAFIAPSITGGGAEVVSNLYSRADMNNAQHLRTVSDIVWSCLATVFACSWVSVHPNIPSPHDSNFSIFRRRMGLMFWAIIAPELLIIWALRQWIEARKIGKKYRSRGWTNVHGHFLIMGGFMLYEAGQPKQTLSIQKFNQLLKHKSIDFPLISEKEILDRSKGDLLSKSIIMIQVAWFAVQCMARRSQGLAITELELVTLAFTTLNGAMYFFWWDKPLDVQSTFRVPLKKPLKTLESKPVVQNKPKSDEIDIAENSKTKLGDEGKTGADVKHEYEPLEVDAPIVDSDDEDEQDKLPLKTKIRNFFIDAIRSLCRAILQPFKEIVSYTEKRGFILSIWRIFVYLPIKNILYGFGNIIESDTSQRVAPGALRVPMFYAPEISSDAVDVSRLVASGLGIIFGAIHLAAWSGEFPTHGAQTAWHVASLIITILPGMMFIVKILSRFFEEVGGAWDDCCEGPLFATEFLTGGGGILVYVPSRFALFVIAFYCLQSVPPSGFQKVVWTSFIPHIS